MESQTAPGKIQEEKKLDHKEILGFCPGCFASTEGGSWGVGVIGDHCMNCGATGTVQIPRWAVDSIRAQASWVGRRYYPGPEDQERAAELKALRALPPSFPGRRAEEDKHEKYRWWVTQDLPGNKNVSSMFKATSAADAIEASRYSLPYVPAEDLESNGK
jgi:hypothetical protein